MSSGSFHLPTNQLKTQVFYNPTTWTIPQGVTMLHIVCIGAGGGGGGGFTGVSGSARGGGGGGGSGAITTLTVNRMYLPDALNIVVGLGGNAGASGAAGGAGTISYVETIRSINSSSIIPTDSSAILIRAAGGNAGSPGTNAAGGAGGGGGGASTATGQILDKMGETSTIVGQTGNAGGTATGAIGPSLPFGGVGLVVSAGAGGAGINTAVQNSFNGGQITGAGFVPTNPGGTSVTISGNPGTFMISPFISIGGSGGASFDSAVGGRGGDGSVGCGGGGGGGGTTGGGGGRGGNGLIIINYW